MQSMAVLGVLSVACGALGAALVLASRPTPPTAVAVELDASYSTKDDFENRYAPFVARGLDGMSGIELRVVLFAGQHRYQLYPVGRSQVLRREEVPALRERVFSCTVFPQSVQGSPISAAAHDALRWLKARPGETKLLILCTDGVEQGSRLIAPADLRGLGEGITVLIFCPNTSHPRVAELLRAGGARVVVATSVDAADRALADILSGTDPKRRAIQYLGFSLLAVSMMLAPLAAWLAWRRPRTVVAATQVPTAAAPASPLPPPIEVILDAELQGFERPLRCRRRVKCGTDAITIAPPAKGRTPDLCLPLNRDTWAICLEIAAINPEALRVSNRGQVPVVIVDEVLKPQQERSIRLRGDALAEIMLTQALCLQVAISLPEEV